METESRTLRPGRILLAGLAACLLSGCVVVPVPVSKKNTLAGVRIQPAELKFMQAGETTLSDVEAKLGSPTVRFDDIRVVAYTWEDPSVLWFWLFGGGGGAPDAGCQRVGKCLSLLVEADAANRVSRYEVVERRSGETVRSHAVAWAKKGNNAAALALPTAYAPVTVTEGKAVLYVYRPGGFEIPSFAVAVSLDGATLGDLRRREYIGLVVEPGSHSLSLNTHKLYSGEGSLDISTVPFGLKFEAVTNQTQYLEIKVPGGRGWAEAHAQMVPELAALPALKKLKPW